MRIGYYVPPTLLSHAGIRRHVDEAFDAWAGYGHEGLLLSEPDNRSHPLLDHLRGDRRAARKAVQLAREGAVDHLHVRLFLPTHPWLGVAGAAPMSLEVHARQWRPENSRDVVRVGLGLRNAGRLIRAADRGVFITNELARAPEFKRMKHRIAIGNGIALTPSLPAPANRRARVGMSVGAKNSWQGLDEFARLAESSRDFDFVVIAPAKIGAWVHGKVARGSVTVALTSDRASYMAELGRLDVATGSLALHREGLLEAAPLKVRDYVAAGIPTVLSYLDTNLSGLADDALLECSDPATDPRFRSWVEAMVGRRVAETSRHAISIDTVEKHRLDAILGAGI